MGFNSGFKGLSSWGDMLHKCNCNLKCNQSKCCLNLKSHCCYVTYLWQCDVQIFRELPLRSCEHFNGFLIIKPNRCTNFSNLFWNKTLHVLDSSFVHHQEFFTVHTTMVYVIEVCWRHIRRIRMELLSSILILLAICQQISMTYTIVVCAMKNS